jgi:hypothetical protein
MLWLELAFQDLRILNGRGVDSNLNLKFAYHKFCIRFILMCSARVNFLLIVEKLG